VGLQFLMASVNFNQLAFCMKVLLHRLSFLCLMLVFVFFGKSKFAK